MAKRGMRPRVWSAKPLQDARLGEDPATGRFTAVLQQGDPRPDYDSDGYAGLRIAGLQPKVNVLIGQTLALTNSDRPSATRRAFNDWQACATLLLPVCCYLPQTKHEV
jgi:hypothetical protein